MNWNSFKRKYGKNTTSNIQLINWAKQLKIKPFYYVMRDEVQHLPKDEIPIFCITNIHTSKEKGVHHSAIAKTLQGNYFFDSYGLPPTEEVKRFLGTGVYSTFQIQTFNDSYCGQISLFILCQLSQGYKFEEIVFKLKIL